MKMLAWLDSTDCEAFAREIAAEFAQIYPVAPARGAPDDRRLAQAIETMGNRAAKYHRQQPLGWFRRARFLRALKEALAERGHDTALVDRAVYAVVLRMARRD